MVQPPAKNRAARWVAVGVLAAFLLAGLAPLAAAEPDERPKRERDRPAHDERPMKAFKQFTIRLNGTAVDRENETYTLVIEGGGRARTHDRDGNVTDAKGIVRLKAQLIDANGTVVKEGVLKGRFHAHKVAEGEWKWQLVAAGRNSRGFPQLGLRGTADASDVGVFDLDGQGRAVVKFADEDHRTVLKLDVSGTVSRA